MSDKKHPEAKPKDQTKKQSELNPEKGAPSELTDKEAAAISGGMNKTEILRR